MGTRVRDEHVRQGDADKGVGNWFKGDKMIQEYNSLLFLNIDTDFLTC